MSTTAKFGLTEMSESQAGKYLTYNDGLNDLTVLAHQVVLSMTTATPPGSPAEGDTYYVPAGATGAWTGQDGNLTYWYNGTWRFIRMESGYEFWVADEELTFRVDGPYVHAVMALAGAPVAHSITTTPTAFSIADVGQAATAVPNPTIIDLTNSRFTLDDLVSDNYLQVSAQASILGSGNNVQYVMGIYKNGVFETHLRSSFTATNQSPNAPLVLPQGILQAKLGDQIECRFWHTDVGGQACSFEAFSFSLLPIY